MWHQHRSWVTFCRVDDLSEQLRRLNQTVSELPTRAWWLGMLGAQLVVGLLVILVVAQFA